MCINTINPGSIKVMEVLTVAWPGKWESGVGLPEGFITITKEKIEMIGCVAEERKLAKVDAAVRSRRVGERWASLGGQLGPA